MTQTIEYGGVRDGHETDIVIAEHEHVRPTKDRIVCEILPWEPSKIVEVVYQGKPLRGRALAVGPGTWLTQYASGTPPVWHPTHHPPAKGLRTASRESRIFCPTDTKVGDIIELGGLEIRGYLFFRFRWGTKDCVLVREADVAMVTDEPQYERPGRFIWESLGAQA